MTHNVVVVASSGNAGSAQMSRGHGHAPYSFPADYPGVIGVAAVGRSGLPAYFSSDNLSVQVAAPGVSVPAEGRGSRYWIVSGTSPACALTAGVAALIKSKYPELTAPQIRRAVIWSAVNRPPGGYDDEVGFGTVDAASALRFAGRLERQDARARTAAVQTVGNRLFGDGQAGVPPVPVAPRGVQGLLAWSALALAFFALTMASLWRFATGLAESRRLRRTASPSQPWPAAASSAQPWSAAPSASPPWPAAAQPSPPWPAAPPRADYWQPGTQAFGYGAGLRGDDPPHPPSLRPFNGQESERHDPPGDPI